MDCMHAERKEQSVFLFFTVKRHKIELIFKLPLQIIYKKAERTDDQMITNNNLVNHYFDFLF